MSDHFIHLRVHSEFSLVDGIIQIKPLIKKALEQTIPALAVTDQSFMCAQIRFYQAAQNAGIKPLCGCDLWVEAADKEQPPNRLTLLCMNEAGYKNLMEIVSLAFQKGQSLDKALCRQEWILEKSAGLIALSGAREGDIGAALLGSQPSQADALLQKWMSAFDNRFYLEIQRTGRANEERYIHAVVALSIRMHCPVVATNEVLFMYKEDFEAHEARVCIGEGYLLDDPGRPKNYSEEQYFKSEEEMISLFKDIPEAIENTVEIARRCNVHIPLGKHHLPAYPVPENMTIDQFFRDISRKSLETRLREKIKTGPATVNIPQEQYSARLDFELDVILNMGFPGYFLIVMDFIQWAKNNGIPVGPGRGSGAGSLVAYALEITDLDPLEYDLLFERFLNPERVSMPDFDIDFCMEGRDRVIDYVAETYGREAVSQIITFGTMAAKAVIRDVARVQGKSYGMADKLSKLIPFEIGMTLSKALEQEENLVAFLKNDSDAREVWEMALKLEGITRNVGKHAGGVVIAPNKLTDFSPLYCDEGGHGLVTQYDKNDVESAGLVKFDFLGLRTLTIINWALKMINHRRKDQNAAIIDINHIDLADPKCYELLKTGETTAIFQLESQGMKDLIKRLLPDCFEDIIALVALFRPGPLQSGMVDNFINRKHGREKVSYPDSQYQHECLQSTLEPTYGIILYQEQVMQIAQVMAGYTLGEADMLRRAMGKKKPEEMAKQRAIFEQGAENQGIDPVLAIKIFDLVEKFAGYGFNKSHSAAYALVSYQTLWLKTYFPAEFMAAVMSSDMQNTDKVVIFMEEARRMGLNVLPPQVNHGGYMFRVNEDNDIVYGLGAVKGVGEGPVEAIVSARESGDSFTSIFDFCQRTDNKKINKRCLEALIRSGAMDDLGPDKISDLNKKRAMLSASLEDAVKAADQSARSRDAGLTDLFGALVPEHGDNTYSSYEKVQPWIDKERLSGEKETLGLYLTGHPVDEYEAEISRFIRHKIINLRSGREQIKFAGLIIASRIMKNKRGEKMAFLTLDDRSGRIDVAVFSKTFIDIQHKLIKDTLVIIEGEVRQDDYTGMLKATARNVMTLPEARENYAKAIQLKLSTESFSQKTMDLLSECLKQYPGSLPVSVHYQNASASVQLVSGQELMFSAADECIALLNALTESDKIEFLY